MWKNLHIQVSETTKSLTDKLSGQEKSFTDKISSCQKTLTDKISAQEKCVKEVTDKIGADIHTLRDQFKIYCLAQKSSTAARRRTPPPLPNWSPWQKPSTASRKIRRALKTWVSLSWAFLCIFVCSPVKGMKTEFATPKDLEKLR